MAASELLIRVQDYDLGSTLDSGQAFRWHQTDTAWTGVIGRRWVRLHLNGDSLSVQTATPVTNWEWLTDYLQLQLDLPGVLARFPDDPPLRSAVNT